VRVPRTFATIGLKRILCMRTARQKTDSLRAEAMMAGRVGVDWRGLVVVHRGARQPVIVRSAVSGVLARQNTRSAIGGTALPVGGCYCTYVLW
jgi:hypothetical protein